MLKRRIVRPVAALVLAAISLGGLGGCVNMPFDRQVFLPVALVEVMLLPHTAKDVEKQEARRKAEWKRKMARQDEQRRAKGVRQAKKITSALRRYRRNGIGVLPEHGSALVAAGLLKPQDFIAPDSATAPENIRVGHTNLAALATLPVEERWAAVRAEAESLPPNVVAHRVGDLVFVYHGVKPALQACGKRCAVSESELWWFVITRAYEFTSPPRPGTDIWLGAARSKAVHYEEFVGPVNRRRDGALPQQNLLRQSLGLCPFTSPTLVRTAQRCPVAWLSDGHSDFVTQDKEGR